MFVSLQLRALTGAGECSPPPSGKQRAERCSHFTSPKVLFHGQSEALTPNPSIVKAIYISHYSHTSGMTEQPTAPSRGVQSPSVITRVSLHLSFNFPLAGRLITGICAGPRDRSHTVLCQAGTGKLARHHLVLNETL